MHARDLPGARVPALVNGVCYASDPIGYPRWFARRFGRLTRSRFPGLGLVVNVAEPELVREVFAGDAEVFHAGEANAPMLEPTVGASSVLTLDEALHLRHRKLLLGPFHGESIRRWESAIREIAEQDIAGWPRGEPFALHERTRRMTLEVILRIVFGVREQARLEHARALVATFADRAHPVTLFPFVRRDLGPLSPWARFTRAREALDAFLFEEIERRRADPAPTEERDVLSLLLVASDEAEMPMSPQEIRDQLVTVLAAGHETTATALAWAFERLLRTPRVLSRLLDSLPDGDEYLDATIKETLRLRPVLTDVARKLTKDIELGRCQVPAGALVMPAITAIHFREDLYPQAGELRPERFLKSPPAPYTWLPFGGGVRRCIGAAFAQLEMRVITRAILEHVELQAASDKPERARLRNITAAPHRGCRVVAMRHRPSAGGPRLSPPGGPSATPGRARDG